ncbi:hypothetical protein [uncultured Paraglaciecola sp.]|uniref:hypothetical protein n=1 Tax=uncultured Paraglaciecola sp. TaxID=1765024 RepID=UPI0026345D7E|nr:hypothetical protein [uncultured Paraglaciecola sp.]
MNDHKIVSFKCTEAERRYLHKVAKEWGITASSFIREAIKEKAKKDKEGVNRFA